MNTKSAVAKPYLSALEACKCSATRHIRLFLLAGIVATLCTACAQTQVKPSRAAPSANHSGFLADYSVLQADPAQPDYLHYVAPGFNPTHYRKFIVETPEILVNTGGQYQALDPARLAEISNYYRGAMTSALSRHYQVVTAPGAGVARIRVAVVGAVEVRPSLKPRDFIPVSALFKVARMAVGKNPYVLRMSMESEALDSLTGAILGETVDSRESTKTVTRGEAPSTAQLHQLVDFWVARFVAKLDKANGYTR